MAKQPAGRPPNTVKQPPEKQPNTAKPQAEKPPVAAKEPAEKLPSTAQHGVIVKFDAEKGFGFIRPKNGSSGQEDVFVHVRNVEGRRTLHAGQSVTYYLTRTDKGLAAVRVQPGSVLGTPYLKFTIIGLGSALVLLLGLSVALSTKPSLGVWLGLWVIACSIASFGVYGYDKAEAQSGGGRVPELVLHLLSAVGGSPGSFVAMRVFHHKTSKQSFQIVFWVIVAIQVALLAFWIIAK
jgi:uncharacterized membrane protein YsdA (DUF1294 family)/cold shock CspA family protein